MRDNASRMEKLVAAKRAIPPEKTTAIDDLKTYQEFTEARLDGLKNLTSAFKSLYDTMTPEQKKKPLLCCDFAAPGGDPCCGQLPAKRWRQTGRCVGR
mgnify:CR=1 FL=1